MADLHEQANKLQSQFGKVEEKMGFLSRFLNPVMALLSDRTFFNVPLKIVYYIIAVANLLLPLAVLGMFGFIFATGWIYLKWWAMILMPVLALIVIAISVVVGVGSFAFWVRRLHEIIDYNKRSHTYMAIRNFGLFIRTLGEWIGLILFFIAALDIISIPVPREILALIGMGDTIGQLIAEAIILFVLGYFCIFIAKYINDKMSGFAAKADDLRDLADIERAKIEIELAEEE